MTKSIEKTDSLLVTDTGWTMYGIVASVSEIIVGELKCRPRRVELPDVPTPTTNVLVNQLYPRAQDLVRNICELVGVATPNSIGIVELDIPLAVSGEKFIGPARWVS